MADLQPTDIDAKKTSPRLVAGVLLLVILIAAGLYYFSTKKPTQSQAKPPLDFSAKPLNDIIKENNITNFSIAGPTLAVTPDTVKIEAVMVLVRDGKDVQVKQPILVATTPNTKYYSSSTTDKKFTLTPTSRSDIRVGSQITVQTNQNVNQTTVIVANEIYINY